MGLFNFLSKITTPVVNFVNEVPQRALHDVTSVNDFVTEVPSRVNNDINTVSSGVLEVSQAAAEVVAPSAPAGGDDILEDQDNGDADNTPDEGDVTDPDDILGDQETGDTGDDQDLGDADNEVDHGDVVDPEDILGDQETGDTGDDAEPGDTGDDQDFGDADNEVEHGDVVDPEDILGDQETGDTGDDPALPSSDPVIGDVTLSGSAAADGKITFEERGATVQVSVAVSGIAEGATADVIVDIAGSTYTTTQADGVWVAYVPASELAEGEISGTATVSVTDANGESLHAVKNFDSGVVVDFTDPAAVSNPQIGEVSFAGAAVADGKITHDEKGETIEVRFEVSGIHPGATAEVNVSVDGASYAAVNEGGVWVARVPAKNLNEGVLSGAVSVKVTDSNGAVTTDADSFNSGIVVDYAEPISDPSIDAITFEGEIFDDNTLTRDELDESFQVRVEVSGVVDDAQTEVTLDVDGVIYETVFENGAFYADVPATELQDGHLDGTATVTVTDTGGQVSNSSANFSTVITTDLTIDDLDPIPHEDQSQGSVEMDLDSMVTYTSGRGMMGVESDFNITLNFGDHGMSNELKASAIQMSEYLSTLFTEDLESFESFMIHGQVGSTTFSEVTIDDYLINFYEEDVDGVGGVRAGANSSVPRGNGPDEGMFTRGSITFDTADVQPAMANGSLNDVVLHEMMHALGFGDWDHDLMTDDVYGGSFRFTGEAAIAAYFAQHPDLATKDEYADLGVPVEANHGLGHAGSHWDRATFDGTQGGLMAAGTSAYYYGGVDAMALASMEDMGYETVWDASAPGEPPRDYDFLPEVVQDPDLVNEPSDGNMMMAEVDDTAEEDLLFSADVDEDGDANQADAGAIPADDGHTGVNDLLAALLGGAPSQDEASGEEASLFAGLDAIIFGRDAPAEDADIFADGSDADTASAEDGFCAGGHGESHFEIAQVASFDLQFDDHLMG